MQLYNVWIKFHLQFLLKNTTAPYNYKNRTSTLNQKKLKCYEILTGNKQIELRFRTQHDTKKTFQEKCSSTNYRASIDTILANNSQYQEQIIGSTMIGQNYMIYSYILVNLNLINLIRCPSSLRAWKQKVLLQPDIIMQD